MNEAMSILIAAIPSIVIALIGAGGFWGYLEYRDREKRKDKNNRLEEISNGLKDITEAINKTDEDVNRLEKQVTELHSGQMQCAVKLANLEMSTELSKAYARDRLNRLANRYMDQGYIPADEVVPFKLLGQAYIDASGNTETKTKYLHCIEELDVKNKDGIVIS